jgi:hypothetical protein
VPTSGTTPARLHAPSVTGKDRNHDPASSRTDEGHTTTMSDIIWDRDDVDLIVAFAGCSLDRSPGKNWVEGSGGLPDFICRIARAIHRTGKSISTSIAIAVSRVKKWAAGADDVDADTRAKAAKALAQWEALKAKNKTKTAAKKATGRGGADRDRQRVSTSATDHDILCLAKTDFNVDMVRKAFDAATSKARTDWRTANPAGSYADGPPYYYVREQWTNFLIVQADGSRGAEKLYKVPYSVDAKQQVSFDDPVEVKTQYVVVKDTEMPGADLSDAAIQQAVDLCERADAQALLRVAALGRSSPTDLEAVLRIAKAG